MKMRFTRMTAAPTLHGQCVIIHAHQFCVIQRTLCSVLFHTCGDDYQRYFVPSFIRETIAISTPFRLCCLATTTPRARQNLVSFPCKGTSLDAAELCSMTRIAVGISMWKGKQRVRERRAWWGRSSNDDWACDMACQKWGWLLRRHWNEPVLGFEPRTRKDVRVRHVRLVRSIVHTTVAYNGIAIVCKRNSCSIIS